MTNPLGTADFFALEAGEALDRLGALIGQPDPPPPADLLRGARVIRGAALMAGHHEIARVGAGLEAVARAYQDGTRSWDAVVREQLGQAVDDLRQLVRQVRAWTDDDSARANQITLVLETLAGRSISDAPRVSGQPRRADDGVSSGVRAFVAREGAVVASALDRAARALRADPGAREPLYEVLRRMQSLRGLAELGELPPLPDVLDGIEQAIGDLSHQYAPAPAAAEVIDAAAHALTRLARDVAERGRPARDADESRRFTDLLLQTFAVERDVVPIEALYHADDPEPVQRPASQPHVASPSALGPVELVSHGDHLGQTADLLAESHSETERGLRLYGLVGALRSAAHPGPDPVGGALAVFARATREALAAGVASREPGRLEACLREAGELLRDAAESPDQMALSRRLLDVAHQLDLLRPPAVVAIETLAYDGASVFASDAAKAPGASPSALERSFATYQRLATESAGQMPSLSALLGPAGASASVAREPAAAAEPPIVPIENLYYRGRAALEHAAALQREIRRRLQATGDLATVRPLMDEILDLVPLALDDA